MVGISVGLTVSDDWVPDECTLATAERPLRVAEFDDLFAFVVRAERREPQRLDVVFRRIVEAPARDLGATHTINPTRLDLTLPKAMEAGARSLADRESQCCTFFTFGFKPDGEHVVMHIEVPSTRTNVLDAIEARIAR